MNTERKVKTEARNVIILFLRKNTVGKKGVGGSSLTYHATGIPKCVLGIAD